jgi:hypothetical protein
MLQMLIQKRQAACNCDEQHLFPIKAVEAFHCFITAIFFAYRFALAGCKANFLPLTMVISLISIPNYIYYEDSINQKCQFLFWSIILFCASCQQTSIPKPQKLPEEISNSSHNNQNKQWSPLKSKTNNIFHLM